MVRDDDYPYVRTWGRLLGSHSYYIRDQVEKARRDGAPSNAVHRKDDGSWMTTDDITSSDTRRKLGLEPLPPRPPEPQVILREVQTAVLWLPRLRDAFGLRDVDIASVDLLRLQFTTGYVATLELKLWPPGDVDRATQDRGNDAR